MFQKKEKFDVTGKKKFIFKIVNLFYIIARQNFEHLNREELLFELDMALQHNQDLNEQLKRKYLIKKENFFAQIPIYTERFPTITELHNQLVEVRNELARQKYVNQVLWRKLNTLIDIHGSNTRNELAVELANYQDELAKLKLQQTRTNDARSVILSANSRSSSGLLISVYCLVLYYPKYSNTLHCLYSLL